MTPKINFQKYMKLLSDVMHPKYLTIEFIKFNHIVDHSYLK
jgi:hypothetical protein